MRHLTDMDQQEDDRRGGGRTRNCGLGYTEKIRRGNVQGKIEERTRGKERSISRPGDPDQKNGASERSGLGRKTIIARANYEKGREQQDRNLSLTIKKLRKRRNSQSSKGRVKIRVGVQAQSTQERTENAQQWKDHVREKRCAKKG